MPQCQTRQQPRCVKSIDAHGTVYLRAYVKMYYADDSDDMDLAPTTSIIFNGEEVETWLPLLRHHKYYIFSETLKR